HLLYNYLYKYHRTTYLNYYTTRRSSDLSSDMEKRLLKKETKPKLQHQTHFQKRLTKTGLIDSIVMAEILDKPKSLRPHQRTRKRSEEHTSELQSRFELVCRLLLEKEEKD